MCFDMVRERLMSGMYDKSFDDFEKDMLLIFENAMAYNPPENFVHQVRWQGAAPAHGRWHAAWHVHERERDPMGRRVGGEAHSRRLPHQSAGGTCRSMACAGAWRGMCRSMRAQARKAAP